MSEKEFVDGLIVKPPHEKAPDFVKCSISIKRKDLGNWLRKKSDDWINLDVKVAKSGKWYAEVNDWKPQQDSQTRPKTMSPPAGSGPYVDMPPDFDDDIPF